MSRAAAALSARELQAVQSESQSEVIRFRLTPSLKRHIEDSLAALGVGDLSAFARGALLNAIELAKLGQDPKWQEFLATVNAGPAKAILGHGLALPEAADVEGRGRERDGISVAQLKRKLAQRRGKAPLAA